MYFGAPLIGYFVPSAPDTTDTLRIMSLAILPTCLAAMYSQSLQGVRHVPSAMAVRSLWTRVLTLIGTLLMSAEYGARGAAIALLAASVLTAVIGAAHWRAVPRGEGSHEGARVSASELLGPAMPLLWVTLMTTTPTFVPTLLLGHWAGAEDLGIYAIAQRIAFLPGLLLIAVTSIVAPMFAGFYQRGDLGEPGARGPWCGSAHGARCAAGHCGARLPARPPCCP
jgi:O-antigen/teichoic acid export membrane protein